jgi:hypothetical protein
MKRTIASWALCLAPLLGQATPATTDWSDIWLDSAEPGWGVTIYQQSDLLFVTFFLYDVGGLPHWYFASGVPFTGLTGGTQNFSGPLYEAREHTLPLPGIRTFRRRDRSARCPLRSRALLVQAFLIRSTARRSPSRFSVIRSKRTPWPVPTSAHRSALTQAAR